MFEKALMLALVSHLSHALWGSVTLPLVFQVSPACRFCADSQQAAKALALALMTHLSLTCKFEKALALALVTHLSTDC